MSLARIITRSSTSPRLTKTSIFLAFSLTLLTSGVKKAASRGIAIIRIGECVTKLFSLLSFHFSGLQQSTTIRLGAGEYYPGRRCKDIDLFTKQSVDL